MMMMAKCRKRMDDVRLLPPLQLALAASAQPLPGPVRSGGSSEELFMSAGGVVQSRTLTPICICCGS